MQFSFFLRMCVRAAQQHRRGTPTLLADTNKCAANQEKSVTLIRLNQMQRWRNFPIKSPPRARRTALLMSSLKCKMLMDVRTHFTLACVSLGLI